MLTEFHLKDGGKIMFPLSVVKELGGRDKIEAALIEFGCEIDRDHRPETQVVMVPEPKVSLSVNINIGLDPSSATLTTAKNIPRFLKDIIAGMEEHGIQVDVVANSQFILPNDDALTREYLEPLIDQADYTRVDDGER